MQTAQHINGVRLEPIRENTYSCSVW